MAMGFAGGQEAAAEVLGGLPWMALVERGGVLVAWNAEASRCMGRDGADANQLLPLSAALTGQSLVSGERRFHALLLRGNREPMPVHVSVAEWTWEGQPCRLLLLDTGTGSKLGGVEGSFLEDVLHATPEATAITHAGRVLHINREFTRLFGFSQAECVGSDLDQLVIPDGRMHENEVLFHGLDAQGRTSMETVRRTRSGELVPVAVLVSRVRLGGEAYGMFVTYRDIRRQKQEEARLQHTALHDSLTGLGNRSLFLNRLELTMGRLRRRPDRRFAVLFLDLDGFKRVNDTLGHALGDALLMRIAERLLRCLRPQDTVARFGGDEFAILLDEVSDAADLESVLVRLQAVVSEPMVLEGRDARVTASIGVVVASPACDAVETLLREADQAMYAAKAAGKSCHRLAGPPAVPPEQKAA